MTANENLQIPRPTPRLGSSNSSNSNLTDEPGHGVPRRAAAAAAPAADDSLMRLGAAEMGGIAGLAHSEEVASVPPPPPTAMPSLGAASTRRRFATAGDGTGDWKLDSYPPVQVDADPFVEMTKRLAGQKRKRGLVIAVIGAAATVALLALSLSSTEAPDPATASLAVENAQPSQPAIPPQDDGARAARDELSNADEQVTDDEANEPGEKKKSARRSRTDGRRAARDSDSDSEASAKAKRKAGRDADAPAAQDEAHDNVASSGPFPRDAARSQMVAAASRASGCGRPGGPTGRGRAMVTVAPSGKVTGVSVSGPFGGTRVGRCVAASFRSVRLPPFGGNAVSLAKSFSVR